MFDFPGSPSSGQVVTGPNGSAWKWDGTKWTAAVAGGTSITIGDTAPTSPQPGAMWWDSVSGQLFVWYADPNTSQWVVANSSLGAQVAVGDAPPASPQAGSVWWDSVGGQLYLWYTDASSSQWVLANSAPIRTDAPNDARMYVRQSQAWTDATTAVAAAPNAVGRNLVHNPLMAVAQRGTGPWTTNGYTLDRWQLLLSGDSAAISQQVASDSFRSIVGDEAARYFISNTFTGTAAATAYNELVHKVESVRRLANKTVTLSFWANASVAGMQLGISGYNYYGSGGSPSAADGFTTSPVTLTLSMARYSRTFVVPSSTGRTLGTNGDDYTALQFWFSTGTNNAPTSGIGVQSGGINLWGVQLEIGSVATPLDYGGSYGDQLRACQRYYQTANGVISYGYGGASSNVGNYVFFPAQMRAPPTVAFSGQSYANASGLTAANLTSAGCLLYAVATATGSYMWAGNLTASADL